MPAYAPVALYADRRLHPKALTLILVGHAALIAAVMTARMDLPLPFVDPPLVVQPIPIPQDPPPMPDPQPKQQPEPADSRIDRPPVIVPVPLPDPVQSDPAPLPLPFDSGPVIGPRVDPAPLPQPRPEPPRAEPVRVGPRIATPPSQLRPPYPQQKLEREEEAALRLRLSIDARGRVVAVEPVGEVDRAFLEAARRHLIAKWRYKPATEDGRAVASSTVITLRFELEE